VLPERLVKAEDTTAAAVDLSKIDLAPYTLMIFAVE
jgi:hypothetical protein